MRGRACKMRTFIAIKLPADVKEQIQKFQKSLGIDGVKWVSPENIHLTLKFLGEINESQLESVKSTVNSSIQEIKSFNISLSEFGAFPDLRRPKVLWLGVKEGKDEVTQLMINLENELAKIGFVPEGRKPVPHITIGRVKEVESLELDPETSSGQGFEAKSFLVESIYLIKSTLSSEGPTYTDLAEYKLG